MGKKQKRRELEVVGSSPIGVAFIMADEERFAWLIERSGAFLLNRYSYLIEHYAAPQSFVEVDNIAWKGGTLFVFEGTRGKVDTEKIGQLRKRFNLFKFNRHILIKKGFQNFNRVRVFHYNFKSQKLIEIDERGIIILTISYRDVGELINILRNI